MKIACGIELAEKRVSKLKEENQTEVAVDFMGAGSKQKKTKSREERKVGIKGSFQGAKKEHQSAKRSYFPKNNNKRSHSKSNDIFVLDVDRLTWQSVASFLGMLNVENAEVLNTYKKCVKRRIKLTSGRSVSSRRSGTSRT